MKITDIQFGMRVPLKIPFKTAVHVAAAKSNVITKIDLDGPRCASSIRSMVG